MFHRDARMSVRSASPKIQWGSLMIRKAVVAACLFLCVVLITPAAFAQCNLADCNATVGAGTGTATPNPQAKIDVNGAIRLFGITYPTTDSGAWFINESGVGLAIQSAGSLRLKTGGNADRVTIDGLGNVGIGTGPTTDAKLSVSGPIRLPGVGYPTTDGSAWVVNESGVGLAVQSGGSMRLKTGGTTDRVTITAAGNVGIGSVPFGIANPLDVYHYIRIASSPSDSVSETAGLI